MAACRVGSVRHAPENRPALLRKTVAIGTCCAADDQDPGRIDPLERHRSTTDVPIIPGHMIRADSPGLSRASTRPRPQYGRLSSSAAGRHTASPHPVYLDGPARPPSQLPHPQPARCDQRRAALGAATPCCSNRSHDGKRLPYRPFAPLKIAGGGASSDKVVKRKRLRKRQR
jgi:hypothetical protein